MTSEISSQLFIVLGSGGVGKTTSAAALALSFAEKGKRAVVITVDPAKRLAQALGLNSLSNEPKEVIRFDNGGSLSALWLDTRTAFDGLVRRYGSSIANIEKILQHRLFNILQNQLGGVEEYLGVERVLTLGKSGDFDVCVLDTPPSRHALDFLESPRHLLRFFDEGVLKVFLNSKEEVHLGFFKRLLQSGKSQALDAFKSFLGGSFLGELAELLQNFQPVQQALIQTATDIESWVKLPSTRFITVSLLEPYPLDEARLLEIELNARGLARPDLRILNKCLPSVSPPHFEDLAEALNKDLAESLLQRCKIQQKLRNKLANDGHMKLYGPKAIVEIPRHSISQLKREHLLSLGKEVLNSWQQQDPTLFSKT